MDGGTRHAVVTDDDHGAILAMTAWFLACILVLCGVMRVGVHFSTKHLPNMDDWFLLVAALLAIGGTVAISLAVQSGLGKREFLLRDINIERIEWSTYAMTILYVLTIGSSKLSITAFLSRLACTPGKKNARLVLCALIVCWTIAITAGVVFECELPRPWQILTGKCIPMFTFWLSAGLVDIVSDIVLIILPIHIVSGLQLPSRKKAIVMFIFALRLILIAIAATRLFTLYYFIHGSDLSLDSVPYFTLTQAHATFSVIIACSPALKPFMNSVRTGMLSISLAKHCPNTYYSQVSHNTRSSTKDMSTSKSNDKSDVSGEKSDNRSTMQSSTSQATEPQFVYVSNEQAKIAAQRFAKSVLPHLPPADPTLGPSKRVSRCPYAVPTSVSAEAKARGPPMRPPPPPEELRPDLSLFVSQASSKCEVSRGSASGESERARQDSRSREPHRKESSESKKGIITKTQAWDVRYENSHHA